MCCVTAQWEGLRAAKDPADVILKARRKGSMSQVTENDGWKVTSFEKTVTEIKSAATLVNTQKNKNTKWFLLVISCDVNLWHGSANTAHRDLGKCCCQTIQEQWVKKKSTHTVFYSQGHFLKSSGFDEYNLKLSSSLHFLHSSHLTGCKVTYDCSKEGMISAAFKNPFKISRRKRLEIYTRSEENSGQSKKILVSEMMSCDPDRKPLTCWVQQIKIIYVNMGTYYCVWFEKCYWDANGDCGKWLWMVANLQWNLCY